MIAILVLAMASFLVYRLLGGAPQLHLRRQPQKASTSKIDELTEYASLLRGNKKYTSAEKVYLQILKIDHKHAPTYSRLGTLYTAQKNLNDAIECFQLASQLSPSGATFYNLGLAYYENRNLMKAVAALEKSIMFEPSVQRYVALAKAFRRLGDGEKMIAALEQAADLDPVPRVLWLVVDAYEAAGRQSELPALYARIEQADPKDARLKQLKKSGLLTAVPAVDQQA